MKWRGFHRLARDVEAALDAPTVEDFRQATARLVANNTPPINIEGVNSYMVPLAKEVQEALVPTIHARMDDDVTWCRRTWGVWASHAPTVDKEHCSPEWPEVSCRDCVAAGLRARKDPRMGPWCLREDEWVHPTCKDLLDDL